MRRKSQSICSSLKCKGFYEGMGRITGIRGVDKNFTQIEILVPKAMSVGKCDAKPRFSYKRIRSTY